VLIARIYAVFPLLCPECGVAGRYAPGGEVSDARVDRLREFCGNLRCVKPSHPVPDDASNTGLNQVKEEVCGTP
jgi:hypothetical protein